MSDAPQAPPSFSLARVLMIAVPVGLALYFAKLYNDKLDATAKVASQTMVTSSLLGGHEVHLTLDEEYKDADGDLVADPPADAAKLQDPAEYNFSYVATAIDEDDAATWKELVEALSAKLGKKVNLVSYADVEEQKRALKDGQLQITAFGTGDVQAGVNEAGFVPVACFADKDGKYQYTMKVIVPADSPIKKIEDLKDKRMTFVRPGSNSGCTAPLVLLMDKYKLQPERDYRWGFSYSHERSIDDVAAKKYEAAAVASDILERRIAAGHIKPDEIRTIFESDPYPPGVVGYAYNLKPEAREAIRATLLEFAWPGTGLEKAFGASGSVKFAPVSYKDDWQSVRAVNEAGVEILASLDGPAK